MTETVMAPPDRARNILSLSGGKDSTALAVYMRQRYPDIEMEYVFCDTGEELKETYDYLDKIEVYLGQPIARLNPDRPFSHYLEIYRGVLPDSRTRWCTRMLKLRPFEKFVGDDPVVSFIGIRADENRQGYVSTKPNIKPRYPFIEDGIDKAGVHRILDESGLGLPDYYKWRSRSGCYFCFFQQRNEWVGLLETHPGLYEKAKSFEKKDEETGRAYTWSQRESLEALQQPERVAQIKDDLKKRIAETTDSKENKPLMDLWEDDEPEQACLICHL